MFGAAEGLLLFGGTVNRPLEVLPAQHCAEHWTTGLQYPAGAERTYWNGWPQRDKAKGDD